MVKKRRNKKTDWSKVLTRITLILAIIIQILDIIQKIKTLI